MLVSAPEAATLVALAESRVVLEHALCRAGLEHDLRHQHRVFLGYLDLEVYVIAGESYCSELESAGFQFSKCIGACIDMRLFQKAIESVFGHKHKVYPVISCVFVYCHGCYVTSSPP